ncbi:MAG: UpxY family transcription antiterminator [Bacteroidales bacterium]|nr:UpxY family transcription antiterminator [Bacteroidales bacterium]
MEKINQLNKIQPKWFAIYTKPRAEKKVNEQLQNYNYEVYLPLKKELRQWKDRLKKVEVPLFNSYVFVRVNLKQYYEIPKLISGFVKFVTIGGQKVAVRDEEIETIKKMLDYSSQIDISNEDFRLNEKVKIRFGQLRGLQGQLVEFRGKYKIALRIDSLATNLLVEINKNLVSKIL